MAAGVWYFPFPQCNGFDLRSRRIIAGMERVSWRGQNCKRCRTAFLNSIPPPPRALLIGEGNGRFLVPFRRAFPAAQCVCVDASAVMLERARRSLKAAGLSDENVEFVRVDVLQWPEELRTADFSGWRISESGIKFDLLVTNFVLDCFRPEQLAELVGRPGRIGQVSPVGDGWWRISPEPASGLGKWRARLILEGMYLFFGWATALPAERLTPPDELLAKNGFVLKERRVFDWGLLHSDLWQRNDTGNTPSLQFQMPAVDDTLGV